MGIEGGIIGALSAGLVTLIGIVFKLINGKKVHNSDNPIDTTRVSLSDMSVYFLTQQFQRLEDALKDMRDEIIDVVKENKRNA